MTIEIAASLLAFAAFAVPAVLLFWLPPRLARWRSAWRRRTRRACGGR
jgi:hypothetical protein